jgi:hypothetical protein
MKTSLLIAAAAVVLIAGGTAGFASELPTYQVTGFPISAVQASLLGPDRVREQAPVATTAVSPHQLSVVTPRTKLSTAHSVTTGSAIR